MNFGTFSRRVAASRVVTGAGLSAVLVAASFGVQATAHAQSGPSCTSATVGAVAENQQAIADVGVGNTASFVCISASGFAGGKSAPVTANGTAGDGCYIVEGLGTSVVAVYRESPAVKQCPDLVRIDVGLAQAPTPTPTAPPATPTPTQPPATATQPPSTATPTPRPATATPTLAPATTAPKPPQTGTGVDSGSSSGYIGLGAVTLAMAGAAAATFAVARRRDRS